MIPGASSAKVISPFSVVLRRWRCVPLVDSKSRYRPTVGYQNFPQPGVSHQRGTALAGTLSELPAGLPALCVCKEEEGKIAPVWGMTLGDLKRGERATAGSDAWRHQGAVPFTSVSRGDTFVHSPWPRSRPSPELKVTARGPAYPPTSDGGSVVIKI
ncbi:Protein of unknown function [Gryllus bimaculatus]|nr:Protein of unknown function [Gryllus bimaculatus]